MPLKIVLGDITKIKCDIIVNSSNEELYPDGAVSKAIHSAAGSELLTECQKIGRCNIGECVVTSGYRLNCKYVIHTVAPYWEEGDTNHLLANCYKNAFDIAIKRKCETIAFPLISAGAKSFPTEVAIKVAINRIVADLRSKSNDVLVYLVVYSNEELDIAGTLSKTLIPEKYRCDTEKANDNSKYEIQQGNFDLTRTSQKTRDKVYNIVKESQIDKNTISNFDLKLYMSYLSLKSNKIKKQKHFKEWEAWLAELDIIPAIKGINYLYTKVNEKFQQYLFSAISDNKLKDLNDKFDVIFIKLLYSELYKLMDSKKCFYYKNTEQESVKYTDEHILYIHKNPIKCQKDNHNIIPVTAILTGLEHREISLTVHYCKDCHIFFMNYTAYEMYKEKYGVLLGNLRMDSYSTGLNENQFLADESPLKLCGYSVNQKDGYATSTREYIISQIIDKSIMSKSEVIKYLEYFIGMNGKKRGNEIALSKWKSDLQFTLSYLSEQQSKYKISHIERYPYR